MSYVRKVWKYLLLEPTIWLLLFFFQPTRFDMIEKEKVEFGDSVSRRLIDFRTKEHSPLSVIRLMLPLFLFSYVFQIVISFTMFNISFNRSITVLFSFFLDTALNTALNTALALIIGTLCSCWLTFSFFIKLALIFSTASVVGNGAFGIFISTASTLAMGVAEFIELEINPFSAFIFPIGWFFFYYINSIIFSDAGGPLTSILLNSSEGLIKGASICILEAILIGSLDSSKLNRNGIIPAIIKGVFGGILFGVGNFFLAGSFLIAFVFGIIFFIGYLIGFSRLLIFPVSMISTLLAYCLTQRNRFKVFDYLQLTGPYWDEIAFPTIPLFKQILLIAAQHKLESAMHVITFIKKERTKQLQSLKLALFELCLKHLEMCKNIEDIAHSEGTLSQYISPFQINDFKPLIYMRDAILDATLYINPLSKQTRSIELLEDLLKNLKRAGSVERLSNVNSVNT